MWEFETLIKQVENAIALGSANALAELVKTFNTPVQNLVKGGWVTSNCSDIIFINVTPLSVSANGGISVDNYVLGPGAYIGFMGNNAEINTQQYNVTFQTAAIQCVVIKKLYTK